MNKVLIIAFGGALGAVLRYIVSGITHQYVKGIFPWGTLMVNLSGVLIIGFLWGIFESITVSSQLRLFFFIGILGSYTTFSTFYLENFHLLRSSEFSFALLNIILSNVLSVVFVFVGYYFSRLIVR